MALRTRVTILLSCLVALTLLPACDGAPPVADTPEPTTTRTLEATATIKPDPTFTRTPEPSATPTPAPTDAFTPRPPNSPTREPTETQTPALTETPAVEPTHSSTPEPTATPTPTDTLTPKPTATPTPTDTPTPESIATPTPTDTHTPVPEPTDTQTPEQLTAAKVYDRVSSSIAYIETPATKGSGVLVEGGYVLTNAHVVWPYDAVRVVFPGGSKFLEVPVQGLDLIADLAVLGPIDAPTSPLELVDGESLPIGAETFLIGYPKATAEFPRPTIVRGLLSGIDDVDFINLTLLRTDAVALPGQSGGALVSGLGEVIGISGIALADGNFGVAASSADILPRVLQLIAGEDPSGLGDRRVRLGGGEFGHGIRLSNLWAQGSFVTNEAPGTEIAVEITGDKDAELTVFDSGSNRMLYLDTGKTGAAAGSFAIGGQGPRFLIVQRWSNDPGKFVLDSSHQLTLIRDPDDGMPIGVGESVLGNIDFPGDTDHFLIHLEEGERVEVAVDSIMVNSFLAIYYEGAGLDEIIVDHKSGGGLFQHDSRIVYRAPHTGDYLVVVQDAGLRAPGGYVVAVEPAVRDAILTETTAASVLQISGADPTPNVLVRFRRR